MPDNLSPDPSLFGTIGQSLGDEAGLFLGDSLLEFLPSLHEGVGESRFAVDVAADGLRVYETGLESLLKWLHERQQDKDSQYDPVTGINPIVPSVPVVNTGSTNSNGSGTSVDDITGVGEAVNVGSTVEASGPDIALPVPMRIEGEAMKLSGGYGIESKDFASGDALIGIQNRKGHSGSAQSTFTGASGTYAVIVGYHDESDGEGKLSLDLGEHQFEWQLNENLKDQKVSARNLVRRVISSGVLLNPGDAVTLTGHRDRGEMVRVDYIEFVPINPGVPLPFRVEAEDMALRRYRTQSSLDSSGQGLIEMKRGGEGLAQFSFPKESGLYDVVVGYYDHAKGDASFSLRLDSGSYEWLGDNNQGGEESVGSLVRRTVAERVLIDKGEMVALTGRRDEDDWARID